MVRDEQDVSLIEHVLLAIELKHLAYSRIDHVLIVADLRLERIFRCVREDIEARKIDDLKVR